MNNTPVTVGLLTAALMADFIDIAVHQCSIAELEKVRGCLETFNRKHGNCCGKQLDMLDDRIYYIKNQETMINEKFLELLAQGKLTLNGCQLNLAENCSQVMYAGGKKLSAENEEISTERKEMMDESKEMMDANNGTQDGVNAAGRETSRLRELLATDKAKNELTKFQKAGWLDENFQPIHLTRPQMGCIVIRMGTLLELNSQWKDFGDLWHIDSELLRTQFLRGQDSAPTRKFNRMLMDI